jgi:hypothetical protein
MAKKQFDSLADYLEAAPKRLADAWELLEQPSRDREAPDAGHRHLRAAIYLAGYAVECALKAYVISRVRGAQRFDDAIQRRKMAGEAGLDFGGRRAHNLELLQKATDLSAAMDAELALKKMWAHLHKRWSTDLRYTPTHWTDRGAARDLVRAATDLHGWVDIRRRGG